MNISKAIYKIDLSEEDLKEALEFYLLKKHSQRVEVTNIKHLVGERTEGYGSMEVDVPYQEGLTITCEEKTYEH